MLAPSPSGRRLGAAVLGYLVGATLLVTWAPFDFAAAARHGWTMAWTWSDLLLNVVLFVPLGFFWQAARLRALANVAGAGRGPVPALVAGALLSTLIEAGQLLLPGRFTSPVDVATNASGALLGAWLFIRLRPRLQLGDGAVRALALDLPLTGTLALLTPLLWLDALGAHDATRLVLLLPLAATTGLLVGSVHGSHLSPDTPRAWRGGAVGATAWFATAALPSALLADAEPAEAWGWLLAASLLAGLVAGARSRRAARARAMDGAQRVERAALRVALPPLALFVTLAAVWPLDALDGGWRGGWVLAPATHDLSRGLLLRALAHLASCTLVGYVTAEWHGRDNRRYAEAWPRVLGRILPMVLLLEWARGWNTTTGASGALVLLAIASGLFGGWLYHLQRDHVRALRARPAPWMSRLALVRGVRAAAPPRDSARDTEPDDQPLVVEAPA